MVKFDVVIGNPPYQGEAQGTSTKDVPIYHMFMEDAQNVSDIVTLITPARFLFDAGATPKAFNRKMLTDTKFKVSNYYQNASEVFPNTQIAGGVAISYWDTHADFDAIDVFSPYEELMSILNKVETDTFVSMSTIIHNRGLYRYSDLIYEDYPEEMNKMSDSRISTNAMNKLCDLFYKTKPDNGYDYTLFYGLMDRQRTYRWFRSDYVKVVENLNSHKVIIPKTGNGSLGDTTPQNLIGEPIPGEPGLAYTETFISVGDFQDLYDAEAAFKYVKSKFARVLLGMLKVTQDVTTQKWAKVPLQDFTKDSDIDWSKSIKEIDQQLYEKYGLSEEEITFIETHVKEME